MQQGLWITGRSDYAGKEARRRVVAAQAGRRAAASFAMYDCPLQRLLDGASIIPIRDGSDVWCLDLCGVAELLASTVRIGRDG
ncbi:hypothetical protein C1I95_20155 [Micromonospora craterilacus]|uniref:Uncharacterized protein n=1 Tax=Micromonospora craterilacus TaxID=1655439 RepID=A0A2W2EDV4_9ACTN|nr:hypothetical protein C1I95_20155 [Micromonospora craterilacus]